MKHGFFQKFGRYLLMGLVISAPAGVTILVFAWAFVRLDNILGGLFQLWLGMRIPGIGFLALLIIVFLIGIFTRSYIGKKMLELADSVFTKLPVAKTIYLTVKQLRNLIEIRKSIVFHGAVLMEYPRSGLYVIGLLASNDTISFSGKRFFPIFIPTTPNPTSGFLIFAEREQFVHLQMSVEDAMKLIISAGIISPPDDAIAELAEQNT